MTESSSHNNKLGFSDFWSSRSRQKESSVATEVRKVRQSRTGLRRLPSAPSCTDQPIAGTLRPQVQEGQEELQLQVSATPAVCHLSGLPQQPGALPRPSPPLQGQYLHIFAVYRRVISQRLPRSLRRAFNFQRHNRKCHLLPFDRFANGAQRQPNVNFTLYEKKGRGPPGSGAEAVGQGGAGCSSQPPVFGVFGISLDKINAPRSPAVKSLGRGELHG